MINKTIVKGLPTKVYIIKKSLVKESENKSKNHYVKNRNKIERGKEKKK